jgi:hypothetical protein
MKYEAWSIQREVTKPESNIKIRKYLPVKCSTVDTGSDDLKAEATLAP